MKKIILILFFIFFILNGIKFSYATDYKFEKRFSASFIKGKGDLLFSSLKEEHFFPKGDYENNKKGNFDDFKDELKKYNLTKNDCQYISVFYKKGDDVIFSCGKKYYDSVIWTVYINGEKVNNEGLNFIGPSIKSITIDGDKVIIDVVNSYFMGAGSRFVYKKINNDNLKNIVWSYYSNSKLGISFLYPKNNKNGEKLTIKSKGNEIKIVNLNSMLGQKIYVFDNIKEGELTNIIPKLNFGGDKIFEGCKVEKINKLKNDVYTFNFVDKYPNNYGPGSCFLNFVFSLKYYKKYNKLVYYGIGQEPLFLNFNDFTIENKIDKSIKVFYSKNLILKDFIISKYELEKDIKLKKYIKKVDNILEKILHKYSKEKILKIYDRLDKLNLEKGKYKRFKYLIIYLKAKIGLAYYDNK